jgi:hypothetical protein
VAWCCRPRAAAAWPTLASLAEGAGPRQQRCGVRRLLATTQTKGLPRSLGRRDDSVLWVVAHALTALAGAGPTS